jgi:hypothetical protein
MAASIAKPITSLTTNPTKRQKRILDTYKEHPDLTVREIGAIADVTHGYVVQTLKRYGIEKLRVDAFKQYRGDIFAGMQDRLLSSVTNEDIKKAPLGSRVLAAAQLYDKERLERDLSTTNLASVHADVAAMKALSMGTSMGTRAKDDNSKDE